MDDSLRTSRESPDNLRDLTGAPRLGTCASHTLTTIGHRIVLHVLDWSICLTFETEPFVFSHVYQFVDRYAGYERFASDIPIMK